MNTNQPARHVVIVGGGFAGLNVVKGLAGESGVQVTLIDRRNAHLFQPLLYQVATGGLSAEDIMAPLRAVFSRADNVKVLQAEAVSFDLRSRQVVLRDGEVTYDTLVLASGSTFHFFGHDAWVPMALPLKTIEDALDIRRQVLLAFERAAREIDPRKQRKRMTFLVVGGGPTGVELCGALGELAKSTLRPDFRDIDTRQARIVLVEGAGRILPEFPESLSRKAAQQLARLGVEVVTGALVTDVQRPHVTVERAHRAEHLYAETILWAAGVKASDLGVRLTEGAVGITDRMGRVKVLPDLTVEGFPEVYVAGDLAHSLDGNGKPLPGMASVAIQQGRYVARHISHRLRGKRTSPFRYWNVGTLAVIGRNAAVADLRGLHIGGILAWLVWALVHLYYLIGYENKAIVMVRWAWDYFTRTRGARLIICEERSARRQDREAA